MRMQNGVRRTSRAYPFPSPSSNVQLVRRHFQPLISRAIPGSHLAFIRPVLFVRMLPKNNWVVFFPMPSSSNSKTAIKEAALAEQLRSVGLRPTQQRMALADLLFGRGNRHITAESLYSDALATGVNVSLATVYNALHTFTAKGLLREITIDSTRSYFDTNIDEHHHFYYEKSGRLEDIDRAQVKLTRLPEAPGGLSVSRIDVVIRIDG